MPSSANRLDAKPKDFVDADRTAVLAVLLDEPFRGLSVEDIVRELDGRDDPPGIVEVRAAVFVRQGLVTEDEGSQVPPTSGVRIGEVLGVTWHDLSPREVEPKSV